MPTHTLPTSDSRIRRLNTGAATTPAASRSQPSLAGADCLLIRIRHCLRTGGYPELSRVMPQLQDSVVVLTGRVSTWHLKQVAQTVVRRLDGVSDVMNHLVVSPQSKTQR
jgi:hypothetical protein